MILEAFQGAIVRNIDGLLHLGVGFFVFMTALAVIAIVHIVRRRDGHQPFSAGERPEPPRSGSGVMPPVDQSARIARLRAELEDLVYAATGGNALENVSTMRWVADRLEENQQAIQLQPETHAIRVRAQILEDALKNARDTLEATKP